MREMQDCYSASPTTAECCEFRTELAVRGRPRALGFTSLLFHQTSLLAQSVTLLAGQPRTIARTPPPFCHLRHDVSRFKGATMASRYFKDNDDKPLAVRRTQLPADNDDRPLSHHVRQSSAASSWSVFSSCTASSRPDYSYSIMSHAPGYTPLPRPTYHQQPLRGSLPPGAAPPIDPRHSMYSLASAAQTPPMYDGRASSTYFAEKDVEQGRQSTYQDFNNEGPRRSYYDLCVCSPSNLSSSSVVTRKHSGRPQSPGSASQLLTPSSEKQLEDLDLARAPVLGNDWIDGEAKREHESRRKTIARERKQKVADFTQGKRKLCGWVGWKQGVFIVFAVLLALGVTLFFVVPRVPSLNYDALKPMTANGGDATFLHLPGNFSCVLTCWSREHLGPYRTVSLGSSTWPWTRSRISSRSSFPPSPSSSKKSRPMPPSEEERSIAGHRCQDASFRLSACPSLSLMLRRTTLILPVLASSRVVRVDR